MRALSLSSRNAETAAPPGIVRMAMHSGFYRDEAVADVQIRLGLAREELCDELCEGARHESEGVDTAQVGVL